MAPERVDETHYAGTVLMRGEPRMVPPVANSFKGPPVHGPLFGTHHELIEATMRDVL